MKEISGSDLSKSLNANYTTQKAVSIADAISQGQVLQSFGVSRVQPRDVTTGTYRGQQGIGGDELAINSSDNNITLTDANSNLRIVIGRDVSGYAA